jgi:hypothetical protein
MEKDFKRRDFLTTCFKAGVCCYALSYSSTLSAFDPKKPQDEKPDPKKLEYCGFKCPDDCTLKKASIENNSELKKKAYEEFKIKEKFGIDFDAEKLFCYGCKVNGKPVGIIPAGCTVRACVISRGYDCCIQCDGLTSCDKELWTSFPKFKDMVIEMQKKFREA